MTENEYDDPVGPPPALARYAEFACEAGLVGDEDEPLEPALLAFGQGVAELCACIGDGYKADKASGCSAGEQIRLAFRDGAPPVAPAPLVVREDTAAAPLELFAEAARSAGLVTARQDLHEQQIEFACRVVDAAASEVEEFGDGELEGNAAENIRAVLYDPV